MRPIIIILILALMGLQYKLWLGDGSLLQWRRLEKQVTLQTEKNDALVMRNRTIESSIQELRSGDQALEDEARYGLGMIKEGEIYYQFVD